MLQHIFVPTHPKPKPHWSVLYRILTLVTGKKEGTRKYREIMTPVIRQPETRSQRNQEPLSDTPKKKVPWNSKKREGAIHSMP